MGKRIDIEEEGVSITGSAFYNPAQKFNRTLTIKIINAYRRVGKKDSLTVFECMSATGLRGIRYCRELEGNNKIVLNDISEPACKEIVANCAQNGISAAIDQVVDNGEFSVEVRNEDCRVHLLQRRGVYDVIDIDPFGTCSLFIDSAVESIKNGGLLCVTSTDAKVLCNQPPESAYKYYGATSSSTPYVHEVAVRIILSYISRVAAKFGKRIEPLVSLSVDFFIRVFVLVHTDNARANEAALSSSFFFLCPCLNSLERPILRKDDKKPGLYKAYKPKDIISASNAGCDSGMCRVCKRVFSMHGPYWAQALHSRSFITDVLEFIDPRHIKAKTQGVRESAFTSAQIDRRIHGTLSLALEEEASTFYYSLSYISTMYGVPTPPLYEIISFLEHNGFSSSLTHCKPNSIKTHAPAELVHLGAIEYFRKYKPELYNAFVQRLPEPTQELINKERVTYMLRYITEYKEKHGVGIDFTLTETARKHKEKRYLKFQDKEGLNWGPMKK